MKIPARFKQQRNLRQYQDKTDEEFVTAMLEKEAIRKKERGESVETTQVQEISKEDFEKKVREKHESLERDYDLTGMKSNDIETVNSLCWSFVILEQQQDMYYELSSNASLLLENGDILKELSKIIKDLRADISKMQVDLNITRKIRSSDQESSVVSEIDNLKLAAKKFYEEKMAYIYCDCGMLLFTGWWLFSKEENAISLTCYRKLDETGDVLCGKVTEITSAKLLELKQTNHPQKFSF